MNSCRNCKAGCHPECKVGQAFDQANARQAFKLQNLFADKMLYRELIPLRNWTNSADGAAELRWAHAPWAEASAREEAAFAVHYACRACVTTTFGSSLPGPAREAVAAHTMSLCFDLWACLTHAEVQHGWYE